MFRNATIMPLSTRLYRRGFHDPPPVCMKRHQGTRRKAGRGLSGVTGRRWDLICFRHMTSSFVGGHSNQNWTLSFCLTSSNYPAAEMVAMAYVGMNG